MKIVKLNQDPRFFLRPGAGDQILLDRLLTKDLFSDPIALDGLVLDAPRLSSYVEIRKKLPRTTSVIVDPQAYRFQRDSFTDHPSLRNLKYYPGDSPFTPEAFYDPAFTSRFIRGVLEEQEKVSATSFTAPAFYVESETSTWNEVNHILLKETLSQSGERIFSSVCGSFAFLARAKNRQDVVKAVASKRIEGVLVLASPLHASTDSPTKLLTFLDLLAELGRTGREVVACRQPAFGLGCMALGLSGFDSGIATTQGFDYASLTRKTQKKEAAERTSGRRQMVYIPQLLTSVPRTVAEAIFSTSGVAGSFICLEPCCRDNLKGSLLKSREHFLYARMREVRELKTRLPKWRSEHFNQLLISSRQMSEKVLNAFPGTPPVTFRHLDIWSRVFAEASKSARRAS